MIKQNFMTINLVLIDDTRVTCAEWQTFFIFFVAMIKLSKSASPHSTSKVRNYLPDFATERVVHAFITSKLDYCNSLYYGLPKYLLKRLRSFQNSAAKLVVHASKQIWSFHPCFDKIAPASRLFPNYVFKHIFKDIAHGVQVLAWFDSPIPGWYHKTPGGLLNGTDGDARRKFWI